MTQPAPSPTTDCPRAVLACLPFLWSRVLFPGTPAVVSPSRPGAWLLLVLLPGLLLYPCLSFHLFEPDEGRYAQIPREMLERGEWVVPYLQSEPYLEKPPLLYWLVMVSFRLFGYHDWAARLVPALAVHGCVLLTYFFGRRSLGERAAFWGALALALAPGFTSIGRLLLLDGPLACCVTLSVFSAFEAVRGGRLRWGWWLLAAAACGLGTLAKGPVALLLLLPPLLAHRFLVGPACRLGPRAWFAFAAVVLAVALPWYVAICLRLPEFAAEFLWTHNVVRFLAPFDHLRPVWFYLPILAAGLLPSSLLAVPFARFLLSGDPATAARRAPELGFALLAGGWCLFFFSMSGCKLPTYILPAYPPLALALGAFVSGGSWALSRWLKAAFAGAAAVLALAHYVALPWYAEFHSPFSRPDAVVRYCGDPDTPVVCYPRSCDSVAFYVGRDDLRNYRSKETPRLLEYLRTQPRTVILFTHRHSLEGLRSVLPHDLRLTDVTTLSQSWKDFNFSQAETCSMAVVERLGP